MILCNLRAIDGSPSPQRNSFRMSYQCLRIANGQVIEVNENSPSNFMRSKVCFHIKNL